MTRNLLRFSKILQFLMAYSLLLEITMAAPSETVTVQAGGTPIVIPIPEGFYRYDGKSAKVDETERRTEQKSSELLAAFCTETDLARVLKNKLPSESPQFHVYFDETAGGKITTESFSEFKNFIKKSASKMEYFNSKTVPEIEKTLSSVFADEANGETFNINETVFLGVIEETPNLISFSTLTKMSLNDNNSKVIRGQIMIKACSLVNINDTMIAVYVNSEFKKNGDIIDAQERLKKWSKDLLLMNIMELPHSQQSTSDHGNSGDSGAISSVISRTFENLFSFTTVIGVVLFGLVAFLRFAPVALTMIGASGSGGFSMMARGCGARILLWLGEAFAVFYLVVAISPKVLGFSESAHWGLPFAALIGAFWLTLKSLILGLSIGFIGSIMPIVGRLNIFFYTVMSIEFYRVGCLLSQPEDYHVSNEILNDYIPNFSVSAMIIVTCLVLSLIPISIGSILTRRETDLDELKKTLQGFEAIGALIFAIIPIYMYGAWFSLRMH